MNLKVKFTDANVTAWGGILPIIKMVENTNALEELKNAGLPTQGSNRGYDPITIIKGLLVGTWCGASHFDNLEFFRDDDSLCKIIGVKNMPGRLAYTRYFQKFDQESIKSIFNKWYRWFIGSIKIDDITLDFDSSVVQRNGEQEGAVKGYNPIRKGRNSHHPLMAFIPELRMIPNYVLRPGNASANTGFLPFLQETLVRVDGKNVQMIRADSGFFSAETFGFMEEKNLNYIIACPFNNRIKLNLASETTEWKPLGAGIDIAEATYKANNWMKPRRIVMVRQNTEIRAKASGKKIKKLKKPKDAQLEMFLEIVEIEKYRYSCFVTNTQLPMAEVYRIYRGRADSENRIREIKHDFSADKFALDSFDANEACENIIIIAYNLFSMYRLIITKKVKMGEREDSRLF